MENKSSFNLHDVVKAIQFWIKVLLQRWLLLTICTILGIALGIYYVSKQPPKYEAEIVFSSESTDDQGSLGGYAAIASQFGFGGGGGGGAFTGDNLIQLLVSKNLTEKALLTTVDINGKPQTLADYYIKINEIDKSWFKNPNLKDVSFGNTNQVSRAKDSILNKIIDGLIKGAIKVEKIDKNLNYVSCKVSSNDEFFSKTFAEQLIDNAINFYKQYKSQKSTQNLAIFQRQLDSVKTSLYGNLEDIAVVTDLNVNPLKNVARVSSQKKQVRLRTEQELVAELEKNVELAKIAVVKETPLIQIIDTPKLPLANLKIGRLKGALVFGFVFGFLSVVFVIVNSIYHIQKTESSTK